VCFLARSTISWPVISLLEDMFTSALRRQTAIPLIPTASFFLQILRVRTLHYKPNPWLA
jgi:hypothetical protein